MSTDRRPLRSRELVVMQRLARRLAERDVAPNAISAMSIVFSLTGAGLILTGGSIGLLVAAVCCQLRLLCNLLDGMVAVEGGRGGKDGAFWNEVPDRVSDILLLAAAGIEAGAPWLGTAAATGAVLTAYVREFGRAEGMAADYRGPMGKPQRMAVLTVSLVIASAEPWVLHVSAAIWAGLWIILLGSALTATRRALRIVATLRSSHRH